MANVLDTLRERGFLAQMTFEDELYKQLEEPTTFYVGFDPTADSCTSVTTSRLWPWRICRRQAIAPLP